MGVRHSIDQKMIKKLPRTRAMFGRSIEFRRCMLYYYSNCALLVQTVGDILHFQKRLNYLTFFSLNLLGGIKSLYISLLLESSRRMSWYNNSKAELLLCVNAKRKTLFLFRFLIRKIILFLNRTFSSNAELV